MREGKHVPGATNAYILENNLCAIFSVHCEHTNLYLHVHVSAHHVSFLLLSTTFAFIFYLMFSVSFFILPLLQVFYSFLSASGSTLLLCPGKIFKPCAICPTFLELLGPPLLFSTLACLSQAFSAFLLLFFSPIFFTIAGEGRKMGKGSERRSWESWASRARRLSPSLLQFLFWNITSLFLIYSVLPWL